ncbi:nucleoside phosphatase family-domain-containing protein [Schizophyllum commune]
MTGSAHSNGDDDEDGRESPKTPNLQERAAHSTGIDTAPAYDIRLRSSAMNFFKFGSSHGAQYDRLEGGMGPSRGARRGGAAWKKYAIGAAAVIGLIVLFGPRPSPRYLYSDDTDVDTVTDDPLFTDPAEPIVHNPVIGEEETTRPARPSDDKKPTLKPGEHPTSFETDPDPLHTTYCTTTTADRIVQYALMIDAGSTGSRIHVYKFNNCNPNSGPSFEYEVFKMTQPGLSSFAGRPEEAAKSLDVLMDEAMRVVPESLRKCTPVAVKATAGLRLLPGSQSADILDAVRQHLETAYPFPIHGEDGIVIMDGKDEGVYAWITANYLLNTIRPDTPKDTPTFAVLDLGGASTQIVFEPKFPNGAEMADGDHKYELKFGGKDHVLYQHSYLGYGLMRARRHVHQLIEFMDSLRGKNGGGTFIEKDRRVSNPCLAQGTQRSVEVEDERNGVSRSVIMDGEGIGSFESCSRTMQLVMAKDAICELKPCSFDGVYQPSLLDAFSDGKVLLLSYFYDRIHPLIPEDKSKVTVASIKDLASTVCMGRSAWLDRWGAQPDVMKELEDRPEWCLDLTFMHSLLTLGYEFTEERDVQLGKQIEGTELGWCLGAALGVVSGAELKCKA